MINQREIKNKISSILNTRKITRAMEMISVIKMKKIEKKKKIIKPYFHVLKEIIFRFSNILHTKKEKNHFFFQKKINKLLFIVVLSSKGLCGSLNFNLFKYFLLYLKDYVYKKFSFEIIIFGKKESIFINQFKEKIINYYSDFYQNFTFLKIQEFSKKIFKNYLKSKINKIFIVYNKTRNQENYFPIIERILPIKLNKKKISKFSWDYIYESNFSLLCEDIFSRFFITKIYYSFLENLINEHYSRMISMKNATENSSNLIKDLQVSYNKARQNNITQELTEIISGASVVLMD